MKFSQDFIGRVREATNLVDLVSQYVQLRKNGANHQGLCPFHNEKSPSFSVHEDKQVYYCFGCKAAGNAISFVQNFQGLTFPETIEYLAKRASIAIPVVSGDSGHQSPSLKATFYKINGLAAEFFHQELKRLPATHEVHKYLEGRGLTEEMVDAYKLGYAPDDWTQLTSFLEGRRAPTTAVEQLGLIKVRSGGKTGHYDLFRHRLMFPIFSPTGDCLGFGGRVLSKEQQPKYLNSPDSQVFHKGQLFYGLDHSAKFIRKEDEVIVVEGYMDWLALAKVSIGNAAATLGTALTVDHAKLIKRYTNRALLLFDGDEAGKAAAKRSLPILLSEGLFARGLFLPNNMDPDDFIKAEGAPALRNLIKSAPDLFDLVSTEVWLSAKGSPTGKIQMMDEMGETLSAIADPRLKSLYSQNLANLLDVDVRLIAQSINRSGAPQSARGAAIRGPGASSKPLEESISEPAAVKIDLSKAPPAEIELLNLILMKEVYLKTALDSFVGESFKHLGCKATFERIAEVYRQMPSKFDTLSALLADQVSPVEMIARNLSEPYVNLNDDALEKWLNDCLKRVKRNFLGSKSKELVKGLPGVGMVVSSDQLEQIMNIQRSRRSINRDS